MHLVMFEPDMAPNVGAMIRLAGCLGVPLQIIEPCGFPLGSRDVKRVALDYGGLATVTRHDSWGRFLKWREAHAGRLVLLSARAERAHHAFAFAADDMLLLGRESAGAPPHVRAAADAAVRVPLQPGARSLNVVVAAAMVAAEALRQTAWSPSGI